LSAENVTDIPAEALRRLRQLGWRDSRIAAWWTKPLAGYDGIAPREMPPWQLEELLIKHEDAERISRRSRPAPALPSSSA
jgi:hypothetical protein